MCVSIVIKLLFCKKDFLQFRIFSFDFPSNDEYRLMKLFYAWTVCVCVYLLWVIMGEKLYDIEAMHCNSDC